MWLQFVFDAVLALLIVYLPGFLVLRGFGVGLAKAFAFGSVVSVAVVYLVAFLLLKIEIKASWWMVVGFSILPGALFCAIRIMLRLRDEANESTREVEARKEDDGKILLAYILVGIVVSAFIFVKPLDGAASFNQQYDNYAHLSLARSFLGSGFFSQSSLTGYPSAWHCLVALVAGAGGGDVPLSANALNWVLLAIVYPSAFFGFLSVLFPNRKRLLLCGAICSLAFTECPWGLVVFGPLYPNALAYSLLPAVMAMFCFALLTPIRVDRFKYCALFLFSCFGLAVAHPNSIFVGIVLLAPFVSVVAYSSAKEKGLNFFGASFAALPSMLVVFAIVILWSACFFSDAFQGIVQFNWPSYLTFDEAVANVALLSLSKYSIPQLLLSVFVLVGVLRCFVVGKNRWLVVSYVIASTILVVAGSAEGFVKHFLAGFWYTDTFRVAAMVAMAGVPLAALGMDSIVAALGAFFERMKRQEKEKTRLFALLAVCCTIALYFPVVNAGQSWAIDTPFGRTVQRLEDFNSLDESAVYSSEEVEFVAKAKGIVPDGAVVVNIPFDGSFLSYGVNGFEVAYRKLEDSSYWAEGVDEEGKLIRRNLCNYVKNPETRHAVLDAGVEYVLLLDMYDKEGERMYVVARDLESWQGIMDISDETEGFEVVLAEGDMRLYHLTEVLDG